MNITLMYAMLAMDAYNRGYDSGINLSGSTLGGATLGIDSSELGEDAQGNDRDQNIGFYAITYTYNGETIISFRGTDDVDGIPNPFTDLDVNHGWNLGAGITASKQGQMALEFYQAVTGSTDPEDWLSADISLTGHSLGGGSLSKGSDSIDARYPSFRRRPESVR